MEQIKRILHKASKEKGKTSRAFYANISPEEYSKQFIFYANRNMPASKGKFLLNKDNRILLNELYFYLSNSNEFSGNLQKGVLLIGPYGSGKSLIMNSFVEVFNFSAMPKVMTPINSRSIIEYLTAEDIENNYLDQRPLYIDDIGKEEVEAKHFGTTHRPFEDVLYKRDQNRALTLGTSNFTIEEMPYARHIIDRMYEHFNVLVLSKEESWRC